MRFSKATLPQEYKGKTPHATIRVDADAGDELDQRGIPHATIVIRQSPHHSHDSTPPGLEYALFLPGDDVSDPSIIGPFESIADAVGRAALSHWLAQPK